MSRLGILVNTDRHLKHLLGFTRAALAAGHEVIIFVMDGGTRLLRDAGLQGLAGLPGVSLSLCDHSAKRHGVDIEGLPAAVVRGSQLNNAMMNHQAERVIVL
ncbi:MAG: DsrE family protein [Betaproteobacteria bacterium]|nr:DsrE family protein [Betaproteobacteria bacterium]